MVLCHLTLLGLSLSIYPVQPQVDTIDYQQSIFRDPFKAAVDGALESAFRTGEQIIVVGSSNALLAFRPHELQALMPGVRVHNISSSSMRADEIRHLVQLAWNIMPEEQHARTSFVVTLIFASFPNPDSPYSRREAGVAQQIRQSGLFRQIDGDFVPRWTGSRLMAATLLRRPLLLAGVCRDEVSRLSFGLRQFVSEAFRRHSVDFALLTQTRPADVLRFPRADTAQGRATNLKFFQGYMSGPLGQAQFDELLRLCRWAGERGTRLVLVGMPVPEWVRSGLPFFAEYRDKLEPILREIARIPSVRFVDLQDADLPMWDSTHPEPGKTGVWTRALATALRAGGKKRSRIAAPEAVLHDGTGRSCRLD